MPGGDEAGFASLSQNTMTSSGGRNPNGASRGYLAHSIASLNSTANWESAAKTLMHTADLNRNKCRRAREDATRLDDSLNKTVKTKGRSVEAALRQKMTTTKALITNLQGQLSAIENVNSKLNRAVERADDVISALQRPLKGTSARQRLRNKRSERENFTEDIDLFLGEEAMLLQQGIDQVDALVKQSTSASLRIKACASALESDIADKVQAYELDAACLSAGKTVGTPVGALCGVREEPPPPVSKKELNCAVNKGGMSRVSTLLPSLWRDATEANLHEAADIESSSKTLINDIHSTINAVQAAHEQTRQKTFSAFKEKVKQASNLRLTISQRMQCLNDELQMLNGQRDVLRKSLEDKQAPLTVLQQRVVVRKKRPARENVRDEVELALQQELQELQGSVNKLNDHVDEIESEIRKLRNSKRLLAVDLHDKEMSMRIDRCCLELEDGATTPALSDMRSRDTSEAFATRNHQFSLHILNTLRTPCPPPSGPVRLARAGKRQYQKPSRSLIGGI